jgi:hypothetical protein
MRALRPGDPKWGLLGPAEAYTMQCDLFDSGTPCLATAPHCSALLCHACRSLVDARPQTVRAERERRHPSAICLLPSTSHIHPVNPCKHRPKNPWLCVLAAPQPLNRHRLICRQLLRTPPPAHTYAGLAALQQRRRALPMVPCPREADRAAAATARPGGATAEYKRSFALRRDDLHAEAGYPPALLLPPHLRLPRCRARARVAAVPLLFCPLWRAPWPSRGQPRGPAPSAPTLPRSTPSNMRCWTAAGLTPCGRPPASRPS